MTAGEATVAPASRGAGPSLACHLRLMACGEDRRWDVNLGGSLLSAQPMCGDLCCRFTYAQTADGGGACVAALVQSHEAAGGEESEAVGRWEQLSVIPE